MHYRLSTLSWELRFPPPAAACTTRAVAAGAGAAGAAVVRAAAASLAQRFVARDLRAARAVVPLPVARPALALPRPAVPTGRPVRPVAHRRAGRLRPPRLEGVRRRAQHRPRRAAVHAAPALAPARQRLLPAVVHAVARPAVSRALRQARRDPPQVHPARDVAAAIAASQRVEIASQ
jgi:hypothetical protein